MGVGSIGGSYGFSSYTTPLNSGPTAGQSAQQADQAQQTRQNNSAEESQETRRQQAQETESRGGSGGGLVTATRGQNLNISV